LKKKREARGELDNQHGTRCDRPLFLQIMAFKELAVVALLAAAVALADEDKKEKDIGTVIGIDLGTTYSW